VRLDNARARAGVWTRSLRRRAAAGASRLERALSDFGDGGAGPRDGPDPENLDHFAAVAVWFERLRAENPIAARRPNYLWSLLHCARIARALRVPRISVLELGVAGGSGLVALEEGATSVSAILGVSIEVHGFDTGKGLPPPLDHRDAPYLVAAGQFQMDVEALRARLRSARLHIGPVRDTIPAFQELDAAPVAFAALDLDYYSSSRDALRLFEAPPERLMPRVLVYVDDALGYPWGESNGVRLAIREFNERHGHRVLDRIEGLKYTLPASERDRRWAQSMWVAHVHDHPRYAEDEDVSFGSSLPLT
jgi:hypothetical protein